MLGLRRLLRASGPRRPPAAAAAAAAAFFHCPPEAALRRLLERWQARNAPPPPGARGPAAGKAAPSPPGDAALQALLRSPSFCHRRPARFARSMAAWFPGEAEGLSPATVALVAMYLARHRLRQPPLLDAVAAFLLRRAHLLDTKMIQKLVFPFSRTNYQPSNHPELFTQLESVLVQKASDSPLATVNIVMSLVQLRYFPLAVLHKVFSPDFLDDITSNPCRWIVRRYLTLLDVAVALEVREYDGARLDPWRRVCMFEGALTADEANHKYSYKGLVAEALRQLVGEESYRQDEVVPPGYITDFVLHVSPSGSLLPRTAQAGAPQDASNSQTLPSDPRSGSLPGLRWLSSPLTGGLLWPGGSGRLREEEPCPGTPVLSSPALTGSRPLVESPGSAAEASPTPGPAGQQHLPKERQLLLPAAPSGASPGVGPGGTEKAEEIHRIVLSVNDKWHYCQSSAVLVGSRAMCNRHLCLLGYHLVQLPYRDLERVRGVEGAKQYLCQKLRGLQVWT